MSYSADEEYAVYFEHDRCARKEHRCSACKEAIRPGDRYCVVQMVYDGTASSIKRCLRCQKIHEHLRTLGEPIDRLWPDERLDCGEEYRDHWGREPPPEIAALAFVTNDEMQARVRAARETNR